MSATPLRFLDEAQMRLLLVGGKGGVGKTTIAAALSLRLAEQFPGRRYLVVSAGPAHSLAGALACPLDSTPRPVNGRANLDAVELDAAGAFSDFKARNGQALRSILTRGTYLDDEDISRFLGLSCPGEDELMAMLRIIEWLDSGSYDTVIVDTAPTGHTLRLLSLPALARAWVAALDRMLEKHRLMSRVYTGRYRRDQADEFLDALNLDLIRLAEILRNPATCQFLPVTLLEPVVLAETERLLASLVEQGIRPRAVAVNRVIAAPDGCPRCSAAASRQLRFLALLASRHPELELATFGEELCAGFSQSASHQMPAAACIPAPSRDLRFFLFCGKGGTGKTTVSCAYALQLSRRLPDKKLLLFSTDPAHSLSDCLAQEIGPVERRVFGTTNLFAVEIRPEVVFEQWKQTCAQEIEEVLDGFSRRAGVEVQYDGQALAGLLDLTPPGLDELMSLAQLAIQIEQNRYDLYVLDTAPAGHTVRLLELLAQVQNWLRIFFEVFLKYREVVPLSRAAQTLVEMSRRIKAIRGLFADSTQCQAIAVTTPAKAAVDETEALLAALDRTGIHCSCLFINQFIPAADGCGRCAALAAEHQRQLERCGTAFPHLEISLLPQWPVELRGPEALVEFLQFAPPSRRRLARFASAAPEEEMAVRRMS